MTTFGDCFLCFCCCFPAFTLFRPWFIDFLNVFMVDFDMFIHFVNVCIDFRKGRGEFSKNKD